MKAPRRSARLLPLLVLALSACTINPTEPYAAELKRLQKNRDLWERKGVRSYDYTVARTCFCGPEAAGPVIVEVRDGQPASARYVSDGTPAERRYFAGMDSVEDLFDTVSRALDRHPDRVEVVYDSRLGYPVRARFDYDENAVDEEDGFTVEGFRRVEGGP